MRRQIPYAYQRCVLSTILLVRRLISLFLQIDSACAIVTNVTGTAGRCTGNFYANDNCAGSVLDIDLDCNVEGDVEGVMFSSFDVICNADR